MLKLLFISKDTSKSIDKNIYFLEEECRKHTSLLVYRKSGRINKILNEINWTPDFILIANDLGQEMAPFIKGLSSINIPVGLIINDIHRFTEPRRHYIRKNNIRHLFTVPRNTFLENYPEYKNQMTWFPHFINQNLFRDYTLKKDIDLLMFGAVNDTYPLRKKILHSYRKNPNFLYHPHPGYDDFKESTSKKNGVYIGKEYAMEINRAKIFFTCPSIYNYPVMKYFEVLACKTLLLAPTFKELEDLGFIPGTHFVDIDEQNFMEKAKYYLEHEEERKIISEQGYKFVHQFHSLPIRAQQLVNKIEAILKNERMS